AEATDAFRKRILNPQKIAVYERWGIVARDGDRLSLSPLGWELARRSEPEVSVFRAVLDRDPLYRSALEWIRKHRLERVTHPRVIAHWAEHSTSPVCAGRENAIKVNAICFFHLCQAAELGTVILGKRGQPARLQVDSEELERHIRVAPSLLTTTTAAVPLKAEKPRVFISCADKSPVVEQVQATLAIAEFECEVVERGKTGAMPLTGRMRLAARSSVAGVILLTADDCGKDEAGGCCLNEAAAMVIGAACAFHDNRVVLLREKDLAIPRSLVDLKQCEFQGGGLSWESGVRLMQAVQEWKNGEWKNRVEE
ncbi:MAG: hypothetical protein ACREAM_07775, partial [Blastocatellia bacterium]